MVKKFKLVTPLYVEVLLRVPQFNNVDEEKAFLNSNSGSNQMSSPSLSKQVGSRLVDEHNIYHVPIPEMQVPEPQFINCDMHETEGGVECDVLNIHNGIDV